ncbi:Uncharacterised protein [Salmonella enterica subsp. enterica]|uniref:Uncharacterized protein n=1 Tax=Salmonella enterica I TaxID=59201 RepID=A0A379WK60_SALET|nr:Uncharacterised protein [Salmonella enterica subsp. enterica]
MQWRKYSQSVHWNAFLRALRKKSRYYLPSHASAIPFFDLLRLFYRFSCSKITQYFVY